jgi:hypothetical protein
MGPMEVMDYIAQQGAAGKQAGEQRYATRLLGQAYADPSQRENALGALAQRQPELALEAKAKFEADDAAKQARRAEAATETAKALAAMPESAWAGAWPTLHQRLREKDPELYAALPEQVDVEAFRPLVQQLAGVSAEADAPKVLSPGAILVGADGRQIASNDYRAPVKPEIRSVPDRFGGETLMQRDPITGQWSRVDFGGNAPRTQPSPPDMLTIEGDPDFNALAPDERAKAARFRASGMGFHVKGGRVFAGLSGETGGRPDMPDYGYKPPPAPKAAPKPADKPLPVSALKLQLDATEALSVADGVDSMLAKFEQQIDSGELDFGPVKNLGYEARLATGNSNPQAKAYGSFKAGLEKLRNDSLRLNKGVQTDGDAQRAWNELMSNINDTDFVKARLAEIRQINARGAALQREKMKLVEKNYQGKEAADNPEDDLDALIQEFGA